LVKFTLRNKCREFIEAETDRLAEAAFERMFDKGELCFYLECVQCRFEIPSSVEVRTVGRLRHADDTDVAKSLFDYAERASFNTYEAEVALVLDRHPEVLWWYQNRVGKENFAIQGFRKNRIFPDFVVQNGQDQKPVARVVVVESKGRHLEGNPDTEYKRKIADHFEKVGKKVSWQKLGEGFDKQQFRFQILDEGLYESWKEELKKLLSV
jgi:type III restriction enzyme